MHLDKLFLDPPSTYSAMCSVRITDSLWPERNIKENPSCSLYNRNSNVGYKVLYY